MPRSTREVVIGLLPTSRWQRRGCPCHCHHRHHAPNGRQRPLLPRPLRWLVLYQRLAMPSSPPSRPIDVLWGSASSVVPSGAVIIAACPKCCTRSIHFGSHFRPMIPWLIHLQPRHRLSTLCWPSPSLHCQVFQPLGQFVWWASYSRYRSKFWLTRAAHPHLLMRIWYHNSVALPQIRSPVQWKLPVVDGS